MDYQRNVLLGSGGDRRNYLQISVGSKFEVVVLIYRREQKPGFEHRNPVVETPAWTRAEREVCEFGGASARTPSSSVWG